jgi:hypothetical protein
VPLIEDMRKYGLTWLGCDPADDAEPEPEPELEPVAAAV